MLADVWIHKWLDAVVEREVYLPEVRQRHNRIYGQLYAAKHIPRQRLVLFIGLPLIYCNLYILLSLLSLADCLIMDIVFAFSM